uniref:Uncharacterized protein n=1 Tax=Sphaerodactylus townsendi TaxID=933632 RepID=A0ACB8ERC1_9SAUR
MVEKCYALEAQMKGTSAQKFSVFCLVIKCKIGSAESNTPPPQREALFHKRVLCGFALRKPAVQAISGVHRTCVAYGDHMCMADTSRKPCVDMLQERQWLMRATNRSGLPLWYNILTFKRKALGKLLLKVSSSQEKKKDITSTHAITGVLLKGTLSESLMCIPFSVTFLSSDFLLSQFFK